MKSKSFYIIIFVYFTFNKLDAQSIYPVLMEQFDNGFHFINPAKPLINNNFELMFTDKKYYGLFENIGVNYFSSRVNLSPSSTKKKILTLNFIHEYDGDFLNRNRANMSYLFQIRVNTTSEMGLGLTGGLFNYFVKSTSTNNGASVWLPDANIGLWF